MRRFLHIALIIVLAITLVDLLYLINTSYYSIQKDVVETDKFRLMNIDKNTIQKAEDFSFKNNLDVSTALSGEFLYRNFKLKNINFSLNKYKQLNSNYKASDKKEYAKVKKAMSAIFDDLVYFPVAKSSSSNYWVSFDDSFGADRNYNGAYRHEGTDIMAQNNISGYYPIVSVTDGVVENIGWLEKGGYRIGIRGNCGGYFYYAHLSSYSEIKKGDKIKAGTLLGYMGDTGYGKEEGTSGNFDVHLHFGIYIKTDNFVELSINPYYILKYLENKLIVANY